MVKRICLITPPSIFLLDEHILLHHRVRALP